MKMKRPILVDLVMEDSADLTDTAAAAAAATGLLPRKSKRPLFFFLLLLFGAMNPSSSPCLSLK